MPFWLYFWIEASLPEVIRVGRLRAASIVRTVARGAVVGEEPVRARPLA